MAELQRLSFGIVLTPLAERQLLDKSPAVADRVHIELVRMASAPQVSSSMHAAEETRTFVVAGHRLGVRVNHTSGTLVLERVMPVPGGDLNARTFRLLLVDDDRFALTLLGDRLRQLNHQVVSVNSGLAALEQDLDAFDAVVCDFVMPEMTGAELLRRVREQRRSSVRFIFITGTRHPEELVREAIRHDADFLPKPVELAQLLELIAERRATAREPMALAR